LLFLLPFALTASACGPRQPGNSISPADTARAGASVTSEEWEGRRVGSVEELLMGKFPGVQVFQGPNGLVIQIRGRTSVLGSNEPLYVIDDMVVQPSPGGALVGLNPNEIQKIEVLRDVGATARWGSRGANGVILITTKRALN